MKRLKISLYSVLAVAMTLGIVSCGPAVPPTPTAVVPTPTAVSPTPTPVPPKATPEEQITLRMWWWGEQEATGMEKWLQESADMYHELHPDITVESTLVENVTMYPNFLAAVAAGDPPDIQVLWGGVLGLEQAWNGNICPISDYWTEEELSHILCPTRAEGYWNGKQYLIPLYMDPWLMAYNKEVFRQSGLDPEKPATTWDEFVEQLEAIKAAGFTPFSVGAKDGAAGAWLPSLWGTHRYDSIAELHGAVLGEEKFTEEKHSYWFGAYKELMDKQLTNDDVGSIGLGEALDRFLEGNVGAIWNVQPSITDYTRRMGEDVVGVMLPPKLGTGKLGGFLPVPGVDVTIPCGSKHKEEAADFLRFLNTPERLAAMYVQCGALPANDQIDLSVVTLANDKMILEWAKERPCPTYNYNYPGDFELALYAIFQRFVAGEITPAEAAEEYERAAEKWRTENPEGVENFKIWLETGLECP